LILERSNSPDYSNQETEIKMILIICNLERCPHSSLSVGLRAEVGFAVGVVQHQVAVSLHYQTIGG